MPQWDNEEEVTSQLTLLGLVGIDTIDENVSSYKIGLQGVHRKTSWHSERYYENKKFVMLNKII